MFLLGLFTGQPAEGHTDVVGKPDYGHTGLAGSGHRSTNGRAAGAETLRPNQTPHQPPYDGQHPRSRSVSANSALQHTVCR